MVPLSSMMMMPDDRDFNAFFTLAILTIRRERGRGGPHGNLESMHLKRRLGGNLKDDANESAPRFAPAAVSARPRETRRYLRARPTARLNWYCSPPAPSTAP